MQRRKQLKAVVMGNVDEWIVFAQGKGRSASNSVACAIGNLMQREGNKSDPLHLW